MALDRNEMARLHEEFLAELHGGRNTRGSGQTWQDPGDGRGNRLTTEFAFAWDGKSTRGKGITVDRATIAKIREQAGGERPEIALRFYDTDDLERVGEDWIAIPAADFGELLEAARRVGHQYGEAVAELQAALEAERAKNAQFAQTDQPLPVFPVPWQPPSSEVLHGGYPPDIPAPPHELWPCKVIDSRHDPDSPTNEAVITGYDVNDSGMVTEFTVASVRVEPISEARNHLFVNDMLVRRGQLYIDGRLEVQVGGPLF
jgi:hypothetical protein